MLELGDGHTGRCRTVVIAAGARYRRPECKKTLSLLRRAPDIFESVEKPCPLRVQAADLALIADQFWMAIPDVQG